MEFPVHPIFENCRRPTAALDRNLAYLGLVEILYGYPIDAVVLTTGCDKTTPSGIMAASHRRHPGHRAVGRADARRLARRRAGRLGHGDLAQPPQAGGGRDRRGGIPRSAPADSAPSAGHCNTMGTASTMNARGRGAGHVAARLRRHSGALPRARPDGLRHRPAHRRDGARRPAAVADPDARELSSTRSRVVSCARRLDQCAAAHHGDGAPRRRRAAARATGPSTATTCRCWSTCSPPGKYLGERFHRAGGVPAVMWELLQAGKLHGDCLTRAPAGPWPRTSQGREATDREVIRPFDAPLMEQGRLPGAAAATCSTSAS